MQNDEKGVGAAHHNQAFDIDEDVLKLGATGAATYAIEYLKDTTLKAGRKLSYREVYDMSGRSTPEEVKELFGE